jgi:AmiR/NasT family two-component response regulator
MFFKPMNFKEMMERSLAEMPEKLRERKQFEESYAIATMEDSSLTEEEAKKIFYKKP